MMFKKNEMKKKLNDSIKIKKCKKNVMKMVGYVCAPFFGLGLPTTLVAYPIFD